MRQIPTLGKIRLPASCYRGFLYDGDSFTTIILDSSQLLIKMSHASCSNGAPAFTNPPNYSFPSHRLSSILRDPQKTPLVLVACGSFSPVTYLHLRMFEMAQDYVRQNTDYEIVGGYLSPVSDMYKKPGLLSATHR
jgi:hypothetical protein